VLVVGGRRQWDGHNQRLCSPTRFCLESVFGGF
jgi:hypothetical protein